MDEDLKIDKINEAYRVSYRKYSSFLAAEKKLEKKGYFCVVNYGARKPYSSTAIFKKGYKSGIEKE